MNDQEKHIDELVNRNEQQHAELRFLRAQVIGLAGMVSRTQESLVWALRSPESRDVADLAAHLRDMPDNYRETVLAARKAFPRET